MYNAQILFKKSLAVALIVVGSLWHFVFEWSGGWVIIAAIAPVNESVWEHLKMGYWALIVYSLMGLLLYGERAVPSFSALLAGVVALEATLLLWYYTYTFFSKHSILWMDISSYVAGSVACQYVVKWIELHQTKGRIEYASLVMFILIGTLLAVFTFYPPHQPIFMDMRTHTYGILPLK